MQKFLVLCLAVAILFDIALTEPRGGNRRRFGNRSGFGRVSGRGFGGGSGRRFGNRRGHGGGFGLSRGYIKG